VLRWVGALVDYHPYVHGVVSISGSAPKLRPRVVCTVDADCVLPLCVDGHDGVAVNVEERRGIAKRSQVQDRIEKPARK
jgi:hypothetical protein